MVNKKYLKKPVKANRIHPEFSGGRLTHYAGLVPFADFLFDKLCFGPALAEQLDLGMAPNCRSTDKPVLGLIVLGYLCGYPRLAHFARLSRDQTVQKLLGLEGPIDENTVAYRLKKAGYKHSVQLHGVTRMLAERVHRADTPLRQGRQWIDCDSTVKGTYGHQEGAEKGFSPHRKEPALVSSAVGF